MNRAKGAAVEGRGESTSPSLLGNQRGFTLIMVLVAVVIVGLTAGITGRTWSSLMQQSREEELLFRGDQYRRAIESYYSVRHGNAPGLYPSKIEYLLKDPRSLQTRRHLRQLYQDPFGQGEDADFELIRVGGTIGGLPGATQSLGGIKGVRSKSKLKPFKQDGFAAEYESFKGAEEYAAWEFVYEAPKAPAPTAGAVPPAPQGGATPAGTTPTGGNGRSGTSPPGGGPQWTPPGGGG